MRPLAEALAARFSLNVLNLSDNRVESGRHELVNLLRIISLNEIRVVAIPSKELFQFSVADASQYGRVGNFVAVKMENGQNGAVVDGIQKLFECQLVANGPVSASPSPTTQATSKSGLSNAAPYACARQ